MIYWIYNNYSDVWFILSWILILIYVIRYSTTMKTYSLLLNGNTLHLFDPATVNALFI